MNDACVMDEHGENEQSDRVYILILQNDSYEREEANMIYNATYTQTANALMISHERYTVIHTRGHKGCIGQ